MSDRVRILFVVRIYEIEVKTEAKTEMNKVLKDEIMYRKCT